MIIIYPAQVGLGLSKPRDDTFLAQVIEEVRKHIFGIDAIVESGTPGLDRAGDIVETRIEDEVAESPGHYLLMRNRLEVVVSCHFCPEHALVRHLNGQGIGTSISNMRAMWGHIASVGRW